MFYMRGQLHSTRTPLDRRQRDARGRRCRSVGVVRRVHGRARSHDARLRIRGLRHVRDDGDETVGCRQGATADGSDSNGDDEFDDGGGWGDRDGGARGRARRDIRILARARSESHPGRVVRGVAARVIRAGAGARGERARRWRIRRRWCV